MQADPRFTTIFQSAWCIPARNVQELVRGNQHDLPQFEDPQKEFKGISGARSERLFALGKEEKSHAGKES
jgi:hypothetical protein